VADFLHAAPASIACAAFSKESRMKFLDLNTPNRKSGRWRARLTLGLILAVLASGLRSSAQLPANSQSNPPSSTPGKVPPPPVPAEMTTPSAATPSRAAARFVVVIDAAHGGRDSGARLSNRLMEKDLVLALSVRLRSVLGAHGISVVTTRESDGAIPDLNRAETANHAAAAACISLHATTSGSGVHLFTSSLTQIPMTRFLPWETAQGAYAEQSLRLSSEIDSAMRHAEIPVTLGRTALRPLDSFTCPAVVVELSPLTKTGKVNALSDPDYQDQIVATMTAAVEQWQRDWRQQP
jgi:N-acetylmuramoyl-L-alanine amidase